MLGREVYSNPYLLSQVDSFFYQQHDHVPISRASVVAQMTQYIEQEVAAGARVWHIARHVLGLFQGQAGGKIWRRYLSEHGTANRGNTQLLVEAFERVLEAQATALKHTQNFGQNN